MSKSKRYLKIFLHIISVLCWIVAIIPAGYVLYQAFGSMDGTIHGFNGEMLYGMAAFTDTILTYLTLKAEEKLNFNQVPNQLKGKLYHF